ncbi:MAG TPA: hypothetical protein VNH15_08555, partial [Elusimicrobiota bacterium]|nr:hypothetical protein [Elusimicrobiota bacterium]
MLTRRRAAFAALLILSYLPARINLWAQFSTPYDPDLSSPTQSQAQSSSAQTQSQAAPATIPVSPEAIKNAGPIELMSTAAIAGLFEQPSASTAPAPAPASFSKFIENLPPISYSQQEYNVARQNEEVREKQQELREQEAEFFAQQGLAISTGTPNPPPPELELPTYGTSLSVTGRKVVGVSYSEKRFLHSQDATGQPMVTNALQITQQLQLRMQGKIGPKIAVNVDYDDTQQNHQDISVVYTGDPDEVVQNVSFGDIDLSLPSTEFVSYDKQLFGIRGDFQYKGAKFTAIASRTQGTTHTKQFFGNSQFVSEDIPDTSYIRYTYYDLTFGDGARLPIKQGSERVYLSNQNITQINANSVDMTATDFAVPSSTYTGYFVQLAPGSDYTMDYVHGIIHFRIPRQPGDVVAVDFTDASGHNVSVETSPYNTSTIGAPPCVEPATADSLSGQPCPRLIKTPGDIYISTPSESGWDREMKTFYNLGQADIVNDNGHGNFILKVLDPTTRAEVGSSLNPQQIYPQTVLMDFADGIAQLDAPFAEVGDPATIDPQIYAPTPISKRIIHAEFSYRFKTFTLEPNIVPQSEIVLLDNQKLNRNVDYYIDYAGGFITFFNPDRIQANSEIDISYEVSAFGGISNTSLLGGRLSYDFNQHFSIGTTLLYQAGSKSPTTPDISDLAQSLMVYDFNTSLKDIDVIPGALHVTNLSAEVAQSRQQFNLNSYAIVDNMEGISQETDASLFYGSWIIATNPTCGSISSTAQGDMITDCTGTNPSNTGPSDPTKLTWSNASVPILDITPNAQANTGQTQNVLDLHYDFSNADSQEQSIVFPFSTTGLDFSQKTILQVVMYGDASDNSLNFRLGGISDDMDGTGGTALDPPLYCANGTIITSAAKTEDSNCNGVLDPGEDVGWLYYYPQQAVTIGGTTYQPGSLSKRFGANNGRIDSEDLYGTGVLKPDDGLGDNYGYVRSLNPSFVQASGCTINGANCLEDSSGTAHNNIDFKGATNNQGWMVLDIPLNISTANATAWTNIKNITISVLHTGSATSGTLQFAKIAVLGQTWQNGSPVDPATNNPPIAGESMLIEPINNATNPNYIPIYNAGGDAEAVFNELYGSLSNLQQQSNSQNVQEQALEMQYQGLSLEPYSSSVTGSTVSAVVVTKRVFTPADDMSQHKELDFLVYGNAQATNGSQCPATQTYPISAGTPDCSNNIFFLRAGTDQSFYEIDVPITFTGWKLIKVDQALNAFRVAQSWTADSSDPPGTIVVSSGTPNLQQVSELVAGVKLSSYTFDSNAKPTGTSPYFESPGPGLNLTQGEETVYLDEIFLAKPVTRVGNAYDFQGDFAVPNWGTFGAKSRYVDRNFQTPTSVVSNQDNELDNAYMNLTRLRYFPMSFNVSRAVVNTPDVAQTGNLSNLVNLLQEGRVVTWNGSAQGTFNLGALPQVTLGYTRNQIDYDLLGRTDDRQTYTSALQYGVPTQSHFLPRTINLTYSYSKYSVNYNSLNVLEQPGNDNTADITNTYGAKIDFVPWNGSSFDPNYALTTVTEKRQNFSAGYGQDFSYPLSLNQTAGFTSNFRVNRWLNPQVNYSINTISQSNVSTTSVVVGLSTYTFSYGDIQTITRNSNGAVTLPIDFSQITPNSKLLKTLDIVNGYQIQDGDVWNNVERGLNPMGDLWIRNGLHPTNPAAILQTQTLQDTVNSTQRWLPLQNYGLKGRWAPLKTLSLSNNFVYSLQRGQTTGTPSRVISTTLPDLVTNISQLEQMLGSQSWMANTQLDLRVEAHRTLTEGQSLATDQSYSMDLRSMLFKKYDSLISANLRASDSQSLIADVNTQVTGHQDATVQTTFNAGKFSLTPKVLYNHDTNKNGLGVYAQNDTDVTPSLISRADISMPKGLYIPLLMKSPLLFINRVI